jgi:hypothetical protein
MADASFNNETLHVVKYFNGVLQTKNEKIINDVFNQLVLERSQININANRTTADKIRELDKKIHKENKEVSHSYVGMICMRIFGVLLFIVGIMFIL